MLARSLGLALACLATAGIAIPLAAQPQYYRRGYYAPPPPPPAYYGRPGYGPPPRYYNGDAGHRRYRCDRGTGGTIIGAIAGGLLGNAVAGRGERGVGTVIGAGAGALTGRAIDRNC